MKIQPLHSLLHQIFIRTASLLSISLALSACAPIANGDLPPLGQSLNDRAKTFWKSRSVNDPIIAYQLEEASIQKTPSITDYAKKSGVLQYSDIEVGSIEKISETEARVNIRYKYRLTAFKKMQPVSIDIKDRWLNIQGQWYHAAQQDAVDNGPQKTTE